MNPIVTIKMKNGDVMKIELYPETAPNTVASFVKLCLDYKTSCISFRVCL